MWRVVYIHKPGDVRAKEFRERADAKRFIERLERPSQYLTLARIKTDAPDQ